jgi:hypothetical protein
VADTPDRSELRRLTEAATPGPWHALIDNYGEDTWPGSMFITNDPSEGQAALGRDFTQDDARLIVAAVNALPGLLDALDSRDAQLAKLRELIGELAHDYHHTGSIRDHADPNDKTGWNVKGIETCDDVLCREARAALGGSDDA